MIPIRQKLKQHMMDQVYLETYDQVDEMITSIVWRDITTPLFHVTYKQLFIIIHRHLQEYIKD